MPASVFIGIGSNLSQPIQQVLQAINEIKKLKSTELTTASSLYTTPPMGPQDQPHYINAVVNIQTSQQPLELLDSLQAIEQQHDRSRDTGHWGARTLDLDMLLYDAQTLNSPRLTLPHPRLQERSFVLYPLQEISPNLHIANVGLVKALIDRLNETIPPIISTKNLEI
jgi:2-amino-4-hydroxy-6-hydroxymethyldihydropteridine diphosphokinase